MVWVMLVIVLILGIAVGRCYGWMKYHYPEFQEEIRIKVARKRLERISIEADEAKIRARIEKFHANADESLDRRIGTNDHTFQG